MTVKEFALDQWRRLLLRSLVVRYSLFSVVFWTVALIGAVWIAEAGWGNLNWILLGIWGWFAWPGLIFHLQMIVDVLSYGTTGRTIYFPLILELTEHNEFERKRDSLHPDVLRYLEIFERVYVFVAKTSPISAIAVWAVIVLNRLPAEAHKRADRAEISVALSLAKKMETATIEEFAHRHFAIAS